MYSITYQHSVHIPKKCLRAILAAFVQYDLYWVLRGVESFIVHVHSRCMEVSVCLAAIEFHGCGACEVSGHWNQRLLKEKRNTKSSCHYAS